MKKKILLVACNNLNIGGIQSVIMTIVKNLHSVYTFDVVCFDSQKAYYDDEFESYGGKIFRVPFYEGNLVFFRRLNFYIRSPYLYYNALKILKKGNYRAIHCHNGYESGIFCKAAKKQKVPIRLAHVHTTEPGWEKFNFIRMIQTRWLRKEMFANATGLLSCSELAAEAWYGKGCGNQTVYNPVDLQRFSYKAHESTGDGPLLLQVGLISGIKNQLFSLDVLSELKKTYPWAKMILIGNQDANDETKAYGALLTERIRQLHLADSVELLPPDSDVANYMAQADCLLMPSVKEGLGSVVLEGQAVGLTCFVSDSVTREVDCGNCVFLPLNQKKWAQAIVSSYEEEKGRHKLVDMTGFSADTIMGQYRQIYEGK